MQKDLTYAVVLHGNIPIIAQAMRPRSEQMNPVLEMLQVQKLC